MGVCNCSMFCWTLLYVHSSIAIICWWLCLICLPGVSWWLSGSSLRRHGVVCGLWLWYFLIILTYYFCNRRCLTKKSGELYENRTELHHSLASNKGIQTIHRQNNLSTKFLRQLVDRSWDNSSTLYETTRRQFCSKLIDLWLIIIIGSIEFMPMHRLAWAFSARVNETKIDLHRLIGDINGIILFVCQPLTFHQTIGHF